MSFLAYLPGAKTLVKSAGKSLDRLEQTSEALHNAFMPVTVRDQETDYDAPQAKGAKIIEQFRDQVNKGVPITMSLQALEALIDALRNAKALDDRKMLLEHGLILLSRLPQGDLAQRLQDEVIQILFYDLPHPPATYMGQYKWRAADGSGNNIHVPDMGKAGMPYSRSVQASHPLVASELPEPDLVYQSLLRRDKFVPHPAGLSSLMFGFAALVIHSIFRTSFTNWSINETSSYIDLAPLYGNNQEAQDKVRIKDGRGGLHPDTFAEDRLLLLPPATAVLLVLFNRNHNYIAKRLLEINERGSWTDPSTLSSSSSRPSHHSHSPSYPSQSSSQTSLEAQDDEIFNTARLINSTWFANVVFSDYFASILGLVREGSSWNLNPFGQIRKADHTMVERGMGNSVSVEFNLLYRWHPTMSLADEQWTKGVFAKVFDGKSVDTVSVEDFGRAMRAVQAQEDKDPSRWNFGGIERVDGKFKDDDLANILHNSTTNPASAFKARGTPEVMRVIEVMSIKQARTWGICSLNDFRRFLQLKPYADFEDWNPDPEIAETARKLYGNIEHLELYPGLQAEEPKPVVPGAGLCPPYTTSRAILADAISLCRGDRFYTAEFTPWNLTAWGFQDCQRDTTNGGFGSMLGRLLLRTLPSNYTYNSTYAWFGLMTPEAMKENLTKLGIANKYDFARPVRAPDAQVVNAFPAVWAVLRDRAAFRTPYVERVKDIMQGDGYLLSMDNPATHQKDWQVITAALADDAQALDKAARFYFLKTQELIQDRSFTLSGVPSRSIDIVGEVLNLVPIHYVSSAIAGFPLKTKQYPHGTYMERELLQMLRDIFSYVFFELDTAKRMRAKEVAKSHTQELLGHIKTHLKNIEHPGGLFQSISEFFNGPTEGPSLEFLQKLVATKKPRNELANDVLSVVLIASVEFSQALVHVVNLYMEDANAEHRKNIVSLAQTSGPASDAQLQGYVREALRLDPSIRGAYRYAQRDYEASGVKVSKDQPVFLSLANANVDPDVFSNPTQIDPSRPVEGYLSLNDAVYGALGDHFVEKTIAQVLRAIFRLKNIRRGPGDCGTLKRVMCNINGTNMYEYLDTNRELSPWARSMTLQYDV